MSDKTFIHTHVHTEFSLLDGLSRIKKLVARAKELEMPALAITDHGTMFGVMDFYNACTDAGVKPIIGVEAYLAPRGMTDRDAQLDRRPFHMLLLAKNQQGYRNLLRISSEAQLNGYYYRPRIDLEFLKNHSEGLIGTTGCLAAKIPSMLMAGQEDQARETIGEFSEIFGKDNFYLEVQHHDIPEIHPVNKWLIEYNRENHTNVGLVATNDTHYVLKEDYDAHDTLLCIQTSALKSETNRLSLSDNSYYLSSTEEMWGHFGEIPDAIYNTQKIADMVDVDLDRKGYHLPIFPVPDGYEAHTYLRYLAEKGLEWRYDNRKVDEVFVKRLDRELNIIHDMGFDTYFLIVWDLCEFARFADIWWNVRGSGAGSLVAYCLGITNIDPIQNNLLFERFLNPGRVSMPDIDLDYPDDRRGEMIAYVANKYGEDKVAAIITFGTMGAKAAVRDVGRALDVPLADVMRVASLIPQEAKQKPLAVYVDTIPDLKNLYNSDRKIKQIIDTAKELQGVNRHASTHAAGVIIGDRALVEYLPLHRITGKDPSGGSLKAVTQFPMETCEAIGLLKVDFLGLSTLTILRKAAALIEQHRGIKYTMDTIPYRHDDPKLSKKDIADLDKAFELMGRGETVGVFQVESSGMQQMLRGMRPQKFEHIIAAISLYRPGPMDFIPQYNDRLHGKEEVTFHHEKLKPILEETFSIIVYQEQIMQIAGQLFDYDLGEADLMRRAVSKKKEKELKKHKDIFMERGPANGISEDVSEKIFDEIEFFANYGFNKCLVGSTEIVDAETGRLVRIEDLVTGKSQITQTLSCNTDKLQLQSGKVVDVMENGVKPVYRLMTQLGRQIDATDNHPFLTFNGWCDLGDLAVGEKIAVPRSLPIEGTHKWADHQVIVLGHLLAEGNLCHPWGLYYYTGNEDQWRDYVHNLEQFDNTIASTHERRDQYEVYSKRINRKNVAGVVAWIEQLGLRNKDSYTKFIPDEVFELNNRQVAVLIARMWEGDGHINEKGRSCYYATSSKRMAQQLQHLLLRLGISARLREVEFPYKDGRIGYQLFITGNSNLKTFSEIVGLNFVSAVRKEILSRMVLTNPLSFSSKDVLPLEIKDIVRREKDARNVTWKEVSELTGVATTTFNRVASGSKVGFTRDVIAPLAEYFDCEELRIHVDNDIYWDTIASIEYIGEEQTYDLTIEDTHNFVANDIIVHNSHASDYAVITVQTAFLKTHYTEEYMAALLTVQRDDSAKVSHFLEECRRLDIPILPPDVNYSMLDFDIQPEEETAKRGIRFGVAAIKNAGVGALEFIINERAENGIFKNLEDFCQRVDLRQVGKRTMESLIKVGALRDFGKRSQLYHALERIMGFSANIHKDKEVGQMNMFGDSMGMAEELLQNLPDMQEFTDREMLGWEKELLGLYVTGRPVDKYREELSRTSTVAVQMLKQDASIYQEKSVAIAGEISELRKIYTKNNAAMAVAQIEDWHDSAGTIEVVLFPRTWDRVMQLVESEELTGFDEGTVVMIGGKFDTSRGDPQIIADTVTQNFSIMDKGDTSTEINYSKHEPEWSSQESSSANEPPPAWGNDDEMFDEETGEIVKLAPTPIPEAVTAVAPATQGAVAHPTPAVEPQFPSNGSTSTHTDDAPEWAKGDPDAIAIEPLEGGNGDLPPERWVQIYFRRSGDDSRDRRRLQRVHGILIQYHGTDRFTIVVEGRSKSEKPMILEFPNNTTSYNHELVNDLLPILDNEKDIEVFDRPM